jgi:hypothetical protein
LSLVHFEVNFFYIYPIAKHYSKNPTMVHVKMVTESLAKRFKCNIESDYTLEQDAILTCSDEDFIILMLVCPEIVKQSW